MDHTKHESRVSSRIWSIIGPFKPAGITAQIKIFSRKNTFSKRIRNKTYAEIDSFFAGYRLRKRRREDSASSGTGRRWSCCHWYWCYWCYWRCDGGRHGRYGRRRGGRWTGERRWRRRCRRLGSGESSGTGQVVASRRNEVAEGADVGFFAYNDAEELQKILDKLIRRNCKIMQSQILKCVSKWFRRGVLKYPVVYMNNPIIPHQTSYAQISHWKK